MCVLNRIVRLCLSEMKEKPGLLKPRWCLVSPVSKLQVSAYSRFPQVELPSRYHQHQKLICDKLGAPIKYLGYPRLRSIVLRTDEHPYYCSASTMNLQCSTTPVRVNRTIPLRTSPFLSYGRP